MATRHGPGEDELSRTLWRLRTESGLTGAQAAARAGEGFSQAKVSRIERGRTVPAPEDAARLARALGADARAATRVAGLARDLHDRRGQDIPARVILNRGAASFQRRLGRIAASSACVTNVTTTIVPGMFQTASYARAVFRSGGRLGDAEVEEAVAARLARQLPLADPARPHTAIMTEGALRWCAGSADLMVDQIEHVREIAATHVRVGVIPWHTPARVFPLHNFTLYDERAVSFGTETSTGLLTDPRDVAAYVRLRDALADLALFGDSARALLDRITADYRISGETHPG